MAGTNDSSAALSGQRCARCGACTAVCPVYRASGGRECYSGRGRNHLLTAWAGKPPTPVFEDIFATCLLCGRCQTVCPREVDILGEVRRARADFSTFYGEHGYQKFLARKVLAHPGLLGLVRPFGRTFQALLANRLPEESGLRLQLAMFSPEPELARPTPASGWKEAEDLRSLVYFPGCGASHLYPEVAAACRRLFAGVGYQTVVPEGLGCCGLAMDAAGDVATSQRLARKNIAALERYPGRIMISCGSCFAHLRDYVRVLADDADWQERAARLRDRLVELSQLLDELLPGTFFTGSGDQSQPIRVFYHDPCHLRFGVEITREPRSLLRRIPHLELLELPDGPRCCGHGGLFHLGSPEISATIRGELAERVLAMAPDAVTSSCSGCLMQWKTAVAAAGKKIPVLHLAELLLRAYLKAKDPAAHRQSLSSGHHS
ncbi:MAG: (Fe-S)-binding protein [Desulfopila sp.]